MQQTHEARIFTNDNCTGCNRCISACTVPEANFAVMEDGKNKIYVDADKCINCARCIEVCPHDARDYADDTERFLSNLGAGNISIVAAPAIRSNFHDYERLLGALRTMGAKALYDTSFGADICTWGYIRYIQKTNKTGMISQPCPAVVNYIEKHDPGLISSLAPIHSPAMCTAIYMRKYKNIGGEIAFLSPCIAKKDEFDDENTGGAFQYNVTFRKLDAALRARGIDYRKYEPDHFDNDRHGMGSIYPMPGGLKVNVHRVIPDAWVYQVEGQPEVRDFLDEYGHVAQRDRPFLVDVLNCLKGCNIGTGALNDKDDDLAVSRVMYNTERDSLETTGKKKRAKERCAGKTLEDFDKLLTLDDFVRRYTSKEVRPIHVTPRDIDGAYNRLFKTTAESRQIDCSSCGYDSCEEMATAIAKGINHVENCVEYHKSVLKNQQEEIQQLLTAQESSAEALQQNVQQIFSSLSESAERADGTVAEVTQINEEVGALQDIARSLSNMVDTLSSQINRYVTLSSAIVNISSQTKLLSMNASVEAAHAGELGKGFAVVAEEMKALSDQSANSASEIGQSNSRVLPMLEEIRAFSETLDFRTETIRASTESILGAIQLINETEQKVTEAASRIVQP